MINCNVKEVIVDIFLNLSLIYMYKKGTKPLAGIFGVTCSECYYDLRLHYFYLFLVNLSHTLSHTLLHTLLHT
jgi:hypothetical protein